MVKKTKKRKVSPQAMLFFSCLIVLSAIFYTVSIFLSVAMIPTFVALFVNEGALKVRAVSVGALNFAGSAFFVFDLLHYGNDMTKLIEVMADPFTITVAYGAALIGYLLDWSISGIAASFLYKQGKDRARAIEKRHEELVTRWGEHVDGETALDEDGFPSEFAS